MRLRVDPQTTAIAPGDTVSGEVVVLEGGAARAIHARLEFVEVVDRFRRTAHVEAMTTLAEGELRPGAVLPFALHLPAGAPPSLTTAVGRLEWDLVVRVDRALRRDVEERLNLLVERP